MNVPVPAAPCPRCAAASTCHLAGVSEHSHVEYFRCRDCGHVWTEKKANMAEVDFALKADRRQLAKASDPPSALRHRKSDRLV